MSGTFCCGIFEPHNIKLTVRPNPSADQYPCSCTLGIPYSEGLGGDNETSANITAFWSPSDLVLWWRFRSPPPIPVPQGNKLLCIFRGVAWLVHE